jgi:hypothetical protein
MMQSNQVNRDTAAPAMQPQAQPAMATEAMPATNRSSIFSRAVSAAALSVALVTGEAPAQTPTNGAPEAPKAVPVAAPVMTDKSNITHLPNRNFCMDDEGNVLIPRRTQVRKVGQEVQGLPSYGEAFRAICEGVAHLKSMNGGQIPAGQDVKLRIRGQNGEDAVSRSLTLNPERLSTIADLCPAALNAAMADPMNKKAIEAIRKEVNMHVVRTGPDTLSVTFIGKEAGQSVMLSVELAPRQ